MAADAETAKCPCCDASALHPFYSLDSIPVQSNALLTSREQAIAFPTGSLQLAFCEACGFITNTRFDPSLEDQGGGYEATQAFSGTFNKFTKQLASGWVDRFNLRGKTVVEVGCGQGEFTSLIASLADGRGVGVDPRFDPSRHPDPSNANLTFLRERYGPAHASLRPDFVCCRHTLEHIPDAGRLVRDVRAGIGDREDVAVAFEVPDTLRVLAEGAFWDIYYEHCSYFAPGSLCALFRASRFDVTDLRLEYDGQYLILEAKPTDASTTTRLTLERDLDETTRLVAQFPEIVERSTSRWKKVVDDEVRAGRRVALWGSGSKAVGFLTTLGLTDDLVRCVVDINPHKQGTYLPATGQPIVAPSHLLAFRPDLVIVMNPIYRGEIERDLRAMGVASAVLAL